MDKNINVNIPAISSGKKRRKKRKSRGATAIGWEKLRERWPAAPESVPGVGLVSGDSSGIGAAVKETPLSDEFKKTKNRKKRKGTVVLDGEEVPTEILNPPPLPAGHTVTAFGGGLIPGITNGAQSSKVLPRIARRVISQAPITGDQNPMTRVDANNNGLIFDGTWREMPDPTPGGATGAMSVFKKRGEGEAWRNGTPFGGVENLVNEQAQQTREFESWAAKNMWFEFHRKHFDWWTFPIDRGSAAYGAKYDISGEPLKQLKQNPEYLKSLSRAAELYMRSMAWDLKKSDWINNPDFDRGQDPTNNINKQRLFKIGRSLQIHGLDEDFASVRSMAQSLRENGYNIGNDAYWDNPFRYSHTVDTMRTNGITGKMAGISYSPKPIPNAPDGGPQRDTSKEPKFLTKWLNIELANQKFFRNKEIPDSNILTFDWRDDATRIAYLQMLAKGKFRKGFADFGNGDYSGSQKREGLSKFLSENMDLLNGLGLLWGKQSSSHGAFYDQYGLVMTHSGTATNEDAAGGAQIRELLGLFARKINPSQYNERFEAWVRSPLATAIDPKTGKRVNVRLAFGNDEAKLRAEFHRRINELVEAVSEFVGKKITIDNEISIEERPDDISKLEPRIVDKILQLFDDPQKQERLSKITSIKHMADAVKEMLAYDDASQKLTPQLLLAILEKKRSNWLGKHMQQSREHSEFRNASPFDELTQSQLDAGRETMKVVHFVAEDEGHDPAKLTIDELKHHFDNEIYTEPIIAALHNELLPLGDRITENPTGGPVAGAMSIGSSHIKTVDAENTTAEPKSPNSFINHVTSTPSSYISLQKPTDDLDVAKRTGRPISWLIPGQLHPELNDEYNKLVKDVKKLGVTDTISLTFPEHKWHPSKKPTPEEIDAQEKAVEAFGHFSHRYALIFQTRLHMLGVTDGGDSRQIAYGLVQRAATDAARANYLEQRFGTTDMTPDILTELKDDTEEVFQNIDYDAPERINVTVPASVLEKIFADGRLKTQHETNTSMGALNPDTRNIQEVAMFSIHPGAKQRPIYGTVRRGLNEDNVVSTQQYGAATIVLKNGAEKRTTWTQADSLSHQATASTLSPGKTTWDGLHNQSIHQQTKDAYFYDREVARVMGELGIPTDEKHWPYIEAQIHNGISVNDISHIVVDEDWFQSNPEMVAPEFGPEFDEDNWMESPKWVQISKIAESLNIPIILLREGLANTDVLEEPEN